MLDLVRRTPAKWVGDRVTALGLVAVVQLLAQTGAGYGQQAVDDKSRLLRLEYLDDMRAAARLAGAESYDRVLPLLDRWRPKADGPDVRGWEWEYLRALANREARAGAAGLTVPGRGRRILRIDWSPSGKHLAVLERDNEVYLRVLDAGTGKAIPTVVLGRSESGGEYVGGTAWNPAGDRLAAVAPDGSVVVLDPVSGKRLAEVPKLPTPLPARPGGDFARDVAWSSDGKRLAVPGTDGVVRVYDPDTGREVRAL